MANLSTEIDITDADKDERADSSIDTNTINANIDKGADPNTSIDIVDANINKKVNNSGTKTADVDRQTAANDKAHIFFFFFCKALFFSIFFSELKTVSAFSQSSFVSSLSFVTWVKQKNPFFKYLIAKICLFSFNKALSSMSSVLTPLKFYARYFQL